MQIELVHSGVYTAKQRYVQVTRNVFLALHVSGMEYMHIRTPEGRPCAEFANLMLSLVPENFTIDFAYSAQRENYVIECRIPGLSRVPGDGGLMLPYREAVLTFPFCRKIRPDRCRELRTSFQKIIALSREAIPANLFAAEQMTTAILAEMVLEPPAESVPSGSAELLKQAIDADSDFSQTLETLCREIGMSHDHLRRAFFRRYGVTPAEYRTRQRLNRIFELLSSTGLSPKEIAGSVGMKNVTHLYALLRLRFGLTPKELRRQYRDL